jgi:hypothetical protein
MPCGSWSQVTIFIVLMVTMGLVLDPSRYLSFIIWMHGSTRRHTLGSFAGMDFLDEFLPLCLSVFITLLGAGSTAAAGTACPLTFLFQDPDYFPLKFFFFNLPC